MNITLKSSKTSARTTISYDLKDSPEAALENTVASINQWETPPQHL